jgi:hypothetical protein
MCVTMVYARPSPISTQARVFAFVHLAFSELTAQEVSFGRDVIDLKGSKADFPVFKLPFARLQLTHAEMVLFARIQMMPMSSTHVNVQLDVLEKIVQFVVVWQVVAFHVSMVVFVRATAHVLVHLVSVDQHVRHVGTFI